MLYRFAFILQGLKPLQIPNGQARTGGQFADPKQRSIDATATLGGGRSFAGRHSFALVWPDVHLVTNKLEFVAVPGFSPVTLRRLSQCLFIFIKFARL